MLQHITKTRVEIKEGVIRCATKQVAPTVHDYLEVERMALFIHSTPDFGLSVNASDMVLHASADASFAKYKDCKSQSGAMIWFGEFNAPVHVAVNKQTLVTRSSAEAEMVALSSVLEEVLWFRWLLAEIGLPQPKTTIQQDNKSVIMLQQEGPGNGKRGRYINIKYYYASEHIASNEIELVYTATNEMLADGFTKGLIGLKFTEWSARVRNDESLDQPAGRVQTSSRKRSLETQSLRPSTGSKKQTGRS